MTIATPTLVASQTQNIERQLCNQQEEVKNYPPCSAIVYIKHIPTQQVTFPPGLIAFCNYKRMNADIPDEYYCTKYPEIIFIIHPCQLITEKIETLKLSKETCHWDMFASLFVNNGPSYRSIKPSLQRDITMFANGPALVQIILRYILLAVHKHVNTSLFDICIDVISPVVYTEPQSLQGMQYKNIVYH